MSLFCNCSVAIVFMGSVSVFLFSCAFSVVVLVVVPASPLYSYMCLSLAFLFCRQVLCLFCLPARSSGFRSRCIRRCCFDLVFFCLFILYVLLLVFRFSFRCAVRCCHCLCFVVCVCRRLLVAVVFKHLLLFIWIFIFCVFFVFRGCRFGVSVVNRLVLFRCMAVVVFVFTFFVAFDLVLF